MNRIHDDLGAIDLNLLKVFRVLDEERHVTRAAGRLGVTQPALSHALRRLRDVFHDPLYVKATGAMVPTPLAETLGPVIRESLRQLEERVFDRGPFKPELLSRTFHLKTTDMVEAGLVPSLLTTLRAAAPGARVAVTSTAFELPRTELESGLCDLAIAGFFTEIPDGFYRQRLFTDAYLCAVRADHPDFAGKQALSLDAYCKAAHVLISPGGTLSGTVDQVLKRKKRRRNVVAGTSSFTVAGYVTARSDGLLTAPARLVRQLASYLPLKTFEPPIDLPEIRIDQVWHERNHADPPHRWFRELVHAALS